MGLAAQHLRAEAIEAVAFEAQDGLLIHVLQSIETNDDLQVIGHGRDHLAGLGGTHKSVGHSYKVDLARGGET